MSKETELTLKLKELGVVRQPVPRATAICERLHRVIIGVHKDGKVDILGGVVSKTRRQILSKKAENITVLWDEKSALTWLREKGWKYRWTPYYIGYAEWLKIEVARQGGNLPFIADVYPGHELEGLLECMVKIVESKEGGEMTKGKLLEYLDDEIVMVGKELSNSIGGHQIKYWEDREKAFNEIRSILNLHFSISDEEGLEALKWIDQLIYDNPEMSMMDMPDPVRTILKILEAKCQIKIQE